MKKFTVLIVSLLFLSMVNASELAESEDLEFIPPSQQKSIHLLTIYDEVMTIYLCRNKEFEFRKNFPTQSLSHILFYNSGKNQIVAYAKIRGTLKGPVDSVIDQTFARSGVKAERLKEYYGNYKIAFATEVEDFIVLNQPVDLLMAQRLDPDFKKPQGFVALERYPNLKQYFDSIVLN